jgi:hypothetical protein
MPTMFAQFWAAAGHPYAVYPTSYDELRQCTGAKPMVVGD